MPVSAPPDALTLGIESAVVEGRRRLVAGIDAVPLPPGTVLELGPLVATVVDRSDPDLWRVTFEQHARLVQRVET